MNAALRRLSAMGAAYPEISPSAFYPLISGIEAAHFAVMVELSDDRDRVTTNKLIGFSIGFGLFLLLVFKSEPGFVFLLDHANLLFHEAGHPAVGLFSDRLTVYGGTLGQLAFPVILAIAFWRKSELLSCAGSVVWFFENWLNIARYMADARAQELPLVGGGEHDWANIFGRWGVLAHDTQIAAVVRAIGWLGIAGGYLWVVWRWGRDRASQESPPNVEMMPAAFSASSSDTCTRTPPPLPKKA